MRSFSTAFVLLCVAGAPARAQQPDTTVGTGPEPSPSPISWEFEFKFEDPKRIEVQVPGRAPEVYWYMLYTVTNTGDRTQLFLPTAELVTEDLRVYSTDLGIHPLVFNAIKERHKLTYPDLVPPNSKAIGDLRSGNDNARESVAIWRNVDLKSNEFTIYVSGLSGETRFVKNPDYNPKKPETAKVAGANGVEREVAVNPKYFTLRKTLEINYTLPGSAQTRELAEPQRQKVRWIMR